MRLHSKGIKLVALLGLLLLVGGGAALLLTGCGRGQGAAAGGKEEQLYTCGMHPQVIEPKPGNCPICGMKLTPVRKQAAMKPPPAEHKVKHRSEERRVGKECRSRWSPYNVK